MNIIIIILYFGIIAYTLKNKFLTKLDVEDNKNFVKKYAANSDIIRKYIAGKLKDENINHNVRDKDKNISIFRNRAAIAFIDFKKECKEYGHPVARFRIHIPVSDSRIVPYSSDGNCKYPKRNGKLEGEILNIGIVDNSSLDLVINSIRKIT